MKDRKSVYLLRFLALAVVVSLLAGGVGIVLHLLLDGVERLLYGRVEEAGQVLAEHISPLGRFLSLMGAGIASALVWFLLQRKEKLYSVSAQIAGTSSQARQPSFLRHSLHSCWQVISVAAGSPIGKEGAPRELGALLAGRVAFWARISEQDRRLLVACGASAGLAAVYQIPLASTFFTFEVLGVAWSLSNLCLAFGMMVLASQFAHLVVPNTPLYVLEGMSHVAREWWVIVLLAILITPVAYVFQRFSKSAQESRPTDRRLLVTLPVSFLLLAVASLYFPELMGNGSNLAQAAFNGMPFSYALASFCVKWLAVLMTLRAGAYGGTLTPSFALGAVLGLLICQCLQFLGVTISVSNAMALGAVVFLGTSLKAPLSAIGIVVGFTGQPLSSVLPLGFAMGLSYCLRQVMLKLERKQ